jgi:glycosyltransferase involved in cell wall biosynthesis
MCPRFETIPYYRDLYTAFKFHFGSIAHRIAGIQDRPSEDPTVLGFLSNEELFDSYASSAAFVYTSPEPRHLHYSPLEAMIVGTPVLYLTGSMLATLAGASLAGECASLDHMREKAARIVSGDRTLQNEIIATQPRILSFFSDEIIREQWRALLTHLHLYP